MEPQPFARAMQEEMARAQKSYGGATIPAHHIAFTLYDVERTLTEAEQGANTVARTRRYRALRVAVRVISSNGMARKISRPASSGAAPAWLTERGQRSTLHLRWPKTAGTSSPA